MTIFLIIPTLKQGGAERVMAELANSFVDFDDVKKVHIVLLSNADDFYDLNSRIIIHRLGFENKGRLHKLYSEFNTLFKLRRLLISQRPDAVLSFMEKYNAFTILASSFLGIKIFVSDRSNPLKNVSRQTEFLRVTLYRYAAGIIAQTQIAKDVLKKKTKSTNIKVIPNPLRKVTRYPHIEREKIILNVGRLVPEKGQKYLIEAFSAITNKGWKLIIVGDGPLKVKLESQILSLGLEDHVILAGAVKDVDKWLAKASVFAFPSISEGFPNALAEAMSAGLPCVSFDCTAGPRDLISHGENGYLIRTSDVDKLRRALQRLIDDEVERKKLGDNARKIRETLEVSKISYEYFQFMNKVS